MRRSLTLWPGAAKITWRSQYTLTQSIIRWGMSVGLMAVTAAVSFMAAGGGI